MLPTTSTVDLSDRDNKEALFVKEEVTNDAMVFGEVLVDVEGSQKEPSGSYFRRRRLLENTSLHCRRLLFGSFRIKHYFLLD